MNTTTVPQINTELLEALKEATTAYADLLAKYGKPHGWGLIAVQSWTAVASRAAGEGWVHFDHNGYSYRAMDKEFGHIVTEASDASGGWVATHSMRIRAAAIEALRGSQKLKSTAPFLNA